MCKKKANKSNFSQALAEIIVLFSYCFIAFFIGFFLSKNDSFNQSINNWFANLSSDTSDSVENDVTVWNDDPKKAHDGLVLISRQFVENPAVILVDAKGKIIHKWNLKKDIINPEISKIQLTTHTKEKSIQAATDSHLFPNGDLLVSHDIRDYNTYRGMSLSLLDKDSNVKWQLIGSYHHEIHLADNGNIFAMDYNLIDSVPNMPIYGNNTSKIKFTDDIIKTISPNGKIINKISLINAFQNSDFKNYLQFSNFNLPEIQKVPVKDNKVIFDILHLNSVYYLNKEKADKLDFAEEGDLLISMRGINAIAILRPSINKIVWLKTGNWRHQHYVTATKKGTILIFDNEGSSRINAEGKEPFFEHQSRVIEYNPSNDTIKNIYNPVNGSNFSSYWRGYYKIMDDKTIITLSSERGRVRQVTNDGEIIWELRLVKDRKQDYVPYTRRIPMVHYYNKNYVSFTN